MSSEVSQLYGQLQASISSGDHSKVLSLSSSISTTAPDPELLPSIQLLALIHLDKFSEALEHSKSIPPGFSSFQTVFGRLYTLYKLGKYDQCVQEIEGLPEKVRGGKETRLEWEVLKGQALAKWGKWREALKEFESAITKTGFKENKDTYQELTANKLNCLTYLLMDFSYKEKWDLPEILKEEMKDAPLEGKFNMSIVSGEMGRFKDSEDLRAQAMAWLSGVQREVEESKEEMSPESSAYVTQQKDLLACSLQKDYLSYVVERREPEEEALPEKLKFYEGFLKDQARLSLDEHTRLVLSNMLLFFRGSEAGKHQHQALNELAKANTELHSEIGSKIKKHPSQMNAKDFDTLSALHQILLVNVILNRVVLHFHRNKFTDALQLIQNLPKLLPPEALECFMHSIQTFKAFAIQKLRSTGNIQELGSEGQGPRHQLFSSVLQLSTSLALSSPDKHSQEIRNFRKENLEPLLGSLYRVPEPPGFLTSFGECVESLVRWVLGATSLAETEKEATFIEEAISKMRSPESIIKVGDLMLKRKQGLLQSPGS
jgi:tetratricopeptide (TPR) repeat protein